MHFPLHLHSQLEIVYVLHGQMGVFAQQQFRVLGPGEMAVIFPNQVHSYDAQSEDAKIVLIICDLSYTGGYGVTLLSRLPQNPFLSAQDVHANAAYAVMEILQEMKEKKESSSVYMPLIQLILSRVLPQMKLEEHQNREKQEAIYDVVQYIAQHFREPLTLDALSRQLGMSRYHISHLFSEKIKESFPSYLNNLRLFYACEELRDTNTSITQIAMDAGFESQRTFFRTFKARYGMTPMQYRKSPRLNER